MHPAAVGPRARASPLRAAACSAAREGAAHTSLPCSCRSLLLAAMTPPAPLHACIRLALQSRGSTSAQGGHRTRSCAAMAACSSQCRSMAMHPAHANFAARTARQACAALQRMVRVTLHPVRPAPPCAVRPGRRGAQRPRRRYAPASAPPARSKPAFFAPALAGLPWRSATCVFSLMRTKTLKSAVLRVCTWARRLGYPA